jgi:hypothetical protein
MVLLAGLAAMAVFLAEQPARSELEHLRTPPSILAASTPSRSNSLTKHAKQAQVDTRSEARDAELYFTSCRADWDAATHMSRREWEMTCRRVATNRAKFKHQQQSAPSAAQR